MSTENDNRLQGSVNENRSAGRDGGYKASNREHSFNRYNSDGEQRNFRPRSGYQRDGGNRVNGERSYRPAGNRSYNNDCPYNSDRPQRPRYSEDGEQRSYRPRTNNNRPYQQGGNRRPYNQEGGEQRPYRSYSSNFGGNGERPQRPYTPRPYGRNNEDGESRSYAPRTRSYNREGGDYQRTPRRTYGGNQGYQGGERRPFRPRTADYNPNAKYSMKKQIEYKEILTDPDTPIRLNKFLANAGVCSRREADEFISAGVVSVNGEVVTELGTKIKRTDLVKFHDEPVSIEKKVYVLLNKPKDCVTTSDDPQERKTVMDFVRDACRERIYPVGRLDRNTTGVLLLTNDGDLASKLTHPKYLKKKVYHVYCDKNVTKADLDQIIEGVTLEDGEIHADAISYASETDKSQVGIEIHSGKNRIVRRIFESLGYKVIKLDRVYFAGLTKKGLRRGDWRYLTEQEVTMLRMGSFE